MIYINGKFVYQSFSGVQRYCWEITRKLRDFCGDKVQVLAPRAGLKTTSPNLNSGISVVSVGFLCGTLWEQVDLVKYLIHSNPKVLLNLGNTAPLLFDRNITTNHGLAWYFYPSAFSRKFVLWYRFLIPRLLRKSLLVITVSETAKLELVQIFKIPEEKIEVIYPAVSPVFNPDPDAPDTGNYILYVGNLQGYKNIQTLVKAMALLIEEFPDLELWLVGDTDRRVFRDLYLEEVRNIDFKHIKFLGFKRDEELAQLYRGALCLVLPSYYESFGLPVLEAMACGCPVIASNLPALREVAGNSGLYFNPRDFTDLAGKIRSLILDKVLRQTLRQRGITRARTFSWEKSAEKLIKILTDRFRIEL